MRNIRKYAVGGAAGLALALGSAGGAVAQGHGGHGAWGGQGGWGGFGPGFVGGLALGAVTGPGGYGYYGPYAYDGTYAYDYGPACYLTRRVVVDRWGVEHVRRVRVCN